MTKDVRKIQKCLAGGATLEKALEMAQAAGIESYIEDDLLVLEGVILVQPDGGDPKVSSASSMEEALEEALEEEAEYHASLPAVCTVKAWHPAFDRYGWEYEHGAQWRTELVQQPEPACSSEEHEWQRPIEVVGGIAENPGVWANTHGGATITEVCLHCGLTRHTHTRWQDAATNTLWEGVVEYDPQAQILG